MDTKRIYFFLCALSVFVLGKSLYGEHIMIGDTWKSEIREFKMTKTGRQSAADADR